MGIPLLGKANVYRLLWHKERAHSEELSRQLDWYSIKLGQCAALLAQAEEAVEVLTNMVITNHEERTTLH